ncbi:hypothetical protein LTS18_014993 [Coniosporium uncinatum]|uniref:Uncharacterized protein n=1 Tax=Coniosporium uncinatum TaxID=93489 RepID=A0ACC3DGF3_9PEZI|nr:hypothetical protein LTS18_014993 [Coniosporium uncinatum]
MTVTAIGRRLSVAETNAIQNSVQDQEFDEKYPSPFAITNPFADPEMATRLAKTEAVDFAIHGQQPSPAERRRSERTTSDPFADPDVAGSFAGSSRPSLPPSNDSWTQDPLAGINTHFTNSSITLHVDPDSHPAHDHDPMPVFDPEHNHFGTHHGNGRVGYEAHLPAPQLDDMFDFGWDGRRGSH